MKQKSKKLALITGSSSGIGRETAITLYNQGFDVIITYYQNKERAHNISKTINPLFITHLDVSCSSSVNELYENVKKIGLIDVLVNNAGNNYTNDFDKQTEEEWDMVLSVNLKGTFLCSQKLLPLIKDSGRIINISSVSGQIGGPRSPAYAAAKSGLTGLTQCLARFCAKRNITVNCISPGIIDSEMTENTMPDYLMKERLRNILLGRLGTYSEVAKTISFLTSDGANYITGQIINVNGGEYW